jgi:hypothetical protein
MKTYQVKTIREFGQVVWLNIPAKSREDAERVALTHGGKVEFVALKTLEEREAIDREAGCSFDSEL